MSPLEILLAGVVDYAGLFPPAAQQMREAVHSYAEYLGSDDRRTLGRFITPVSRLGEMAEAATSLLPRSATSEPWRISGLVSGDVAAAVREITEFNRRHADPRAGLAIVDVVELKAVSEKEIARDAAEVPPALTAYFEVPLDDALDSLIETIAAVGARAKIRTGGVTADAFPPPDDVIRFIAVCQRAHISFKATAGLHHPLRGQFRLTYEPDSPVGAMYGYLNVFLAAVMLATGESAATARAALLETDPSALRFEPDAIVWRGRRVGSEELHTVREFAISFGSCSFREPIDELSTLIRQPSQTIQ